MNPWKTPVLLRLSLVLSLLILSACSKRSADPVEDPALQPAETPAVETVEAMEAVENVEPVEIEKTPVGLGRKAVLEAGMFEAAWLESARTRVTTNDQVVVITFLPKDMHTLGRSAVVQLRVDKLTVIDVEHFR